MGKGTSRRYIIWGIKKIFPDKKDGACIIKALGQRKKVWEKEMKAVAVKQECSGSGYLMAAHLEIKTG